MSLTNTASDKATTLVLEGYRGNTLTARLTVAGSVPMPTVVTTVARASPSGRSLASAIQPSISMSGRVITIVYSNTDQYPEVGWHQIAFDGRVVLSGGLYFNYSTTPMPVLTDVTVRVDGTININVSVIAGGGEGGIRSVKNETPTGSLNGANATFLALSDFVPESVEVFISGIKLTLLHDYNTSGTRQIQFVSSPLPGEYLRINYSKL